MWQIQLNSVNQVRLCQLPVWEIGQASLGHCYIVVRILLREFTL